METLYDTLKVSEDAPMEVIRAAYKTLASKSPPDKNPGDADAAAMMQKLNRAYEVLGDPEQRAQYDESIRRVRSPKSLYSEPPAPTAPPTATVVQRTAKPLGKFQQIWLPIILAVLSVKVLGAVGAIALVVVYYWLLPRKGTIISSLAGVVCGIVTTTIVTALLMNTSTNAPTVAHDEKSTTEAQSKEWWKEGSIQQQPATLPERDRFGGVLVEEPGRAVTRREGSEIDDLLKNAPPYQPKN